MTLAKCTSGLILSLDHVGVYKERVSRRKHETAEEFDPWVSPWNGILYDGTRNCARYWTITNGDPRPSQRGERDAACRNPFAAPDPSGASTTQTAPPKEVQGPVSHEGQRFRTLVRIWGYARVCFVRWWIQWGIFFFGAFVSPRIVYPYPTPCPTSSLVSAQYTGRGRSNFSEQLWWERRSWRRQLCVWSRIPLRNSRPCRIRRGGLYRVLRFFRIYVWFERKTLLLQGARLQELYEEYSASEVERGHYSHPVSQPGMWQSCEAAGDLGIFKRGDEGKVRENEDWGGRWRNKEDLPKLLSHHWTPTSKTEEV